MQLGCGVISLIVAIYGGVSLSSGMCNAENEDLLGVSFKPISAFEVATVVVTGIVALVLLANGQGNLRMGQQEIDKQRKDMNLSMSVPNIAVLSIPNLNQASMTTALITQGGYGQYGFGQGQNHYGFGQGQNQQGFGQGQNQQGFQVGQFQGGKAEFGQISANANKALN